MRYELRPEAKLKRPARYNEVNDLDFSDSPELKSGNRDSVIDSDGISLSDTLTPNRSATEPSPFTTDASRLSQNPLPEMDISGVPRSAIPSTNDPPKPSTSRKMANVKYVRKNVREDTPPGHKRAKRSNKATQHATTLPDDELSLVLSAPRPSAFPSLTGNAPPLSSATTEFTKHGLRELMEAIDDEDDERVRKIKRQFAVKYEAGTGFWYDDLRSRWPSKTEQPIMTFEDLWPSIRQTIMEQIQNDFAPGTYSSSFYPVRRILGITKEKLDEIMVENAKVWADDEIPNYFREYKKQYPKAIIDPDEPPPPCVVAAIAFLKQNSLPGSLLGEWQTLPAVEGSVKYHTGHIAKSIEPVVPDRILHQPKREHPRTLSMYEALELAWRVEQDPLKQANQKQRNANKLPQLLCRICGQKGHACRDLDENGVHKCPQRRQEVAQHNTEIETLRAQASAEIRAITQRDLAVKTAHPNSTPSITGPIDAAPYLEIWQANRANPSLLLRFEQPAAPPEDGRTRYIDQLQRDNQTDLMWVRNQFANRWSRPATLTSIPHAPDRPANPPNQPPRPQTARPSANPPLCPNTPYLAQQPGIILQQSATPHVPKKRAPYKKKDKKEGPASIPPPNRVVGRDGMVFLSSSTQAQDGGELQRRVAGAGTGANTETIAVSAMGSKVDVNGNVASAAILPPYPYQASPTQKSGHVPLPEKTGAGEGKRQVGGGEEEVPMMDVTP